MLGLPPTSQSIACASLVLFTTVRKTVSFPHEVEQKYNFKKYFTRICKDLPACLVSVASEKLSPWSCLKDRSCRYFAWVPTGWSHNTDEPLRWGLPVGSTSKVKASHRNSSIGKPQRLSLSLASLVVTRSASATLRPAEMNRG